MSQALETGKFPIHAEPFYSTKGMGQRQVGAANMPRQVLRIYRRWFVVRRRCYKHRLELLLYDPGDGHF